MNYYPFHIGDYAVHTRHLSLMEDLAYRRCLDLYYTREHALPADPAQVARLIGMREHVADVEAVLKEFFVPEEHGDWVHARCEAEIRKAHEAAERARQNGKLGGNPYKKEQYNEPGWLYAFVIGGGVVKVGVTKNPQQRLYEHRRKHKGISYLHCVEVADMGACEARLLKHYAAFAIGEQLTLSASQIADLPAYMNGLCTPAGSQMAAESGGKSKAPITQDQSQDQINTPLPPAGGSCGFDRFWAAWPKHIRKVAEKQCREKWAKRDCEPIADRIVAHVEAMKASEAWTKDKGQFIPAPLVYLNQSRWEGATEGEPLGEWHETLAGVNKKAKALGLSEWDQLTQFSEFKARVIAAAGAQA